MGGIQTRERGGDGAWYMGGTLGVGGTLKQVIKIKNSLINLLANKTQTSKMYD